jgi:hypothetical protein
MLGQLLHSFVREHIEELWPHLGAIAEATEYATLVSFISWGLKDAFTGTAERGSEMLAQLVEFLIVSMRRSNDHEFRDDPSGTQVARSIAGLLESLSKWIVVSDRDEEILLVLKWILESEDDSLVEGNSDDPLFQSVNSARGEAVLAALSMRATFWRSAEQDESRMLCVGLSRLLSENVVNENSPAVLTNYGRYLAEIVDRWPKFYEINKDRLLPIGNHETSIWGAVFGAYLVFNGPHRPTATVLRSHYERGIELLAEPSNNFFDKHAERLLMHLIALSLPRSDDSFEWQALLHSALARAEPSTNVKAVRDLSFAIKRQGLEISTEWVVALVSARTDQLAADNASNTPREPYSGSRPRQQNEPSALLELLFACGVQVQTAIGLIRSLIALDARPQLDEVVSYLLQTDLSLSQSGATLLLLVVQLDPFAEHLGGMEPLKGLVSSYAAAQPALAQQILEELGSRGYFEFEDVARQLLTSQR